MEAASNISLEIRTRVVKILSNTFLDKTGPLTYEDLLLDKCKYLLDNINGFIAIFNYTTGYYEYISESIRHQLGYNLSGFSDEQRTNFIFSIIHEKHQKFLLNKLLPTVLQFFQEHSTSVTGTDFRYSCCLQLKNIYNNYHWFLSDTVIIQVDENGLPLRTLITCTNIDQFKKDDLVYYNILKKNSDGVYEVMLEGTENNRGLEFNLTPRELEIINYIARGLTNKQIAHQLSISLHTVQTHRKSIIKKTGCSGTAELTNFAFSRGLI